MLFDVNPTVLMTLSIVFVRLTGLFFALPFFGDPPVPVKVRLFLAIAFTFAIYQTLPKAFVVSGDYEVLAYLILIIKELIIGLVIGFFARIFFAGIVMAASIVGFQMGFGTESLMMADAGRSMTAFSAFHRILLILIFFVLDLHHIFFEGIFLTFQYIPPFSTVINGSLTEIIVQATSNIFVVALKLATPILVALLFSMAALGIMAKSVPQINIFTFSFPVSFMTGLLVYLSIMPMFPNWIKTQFEIFSEQYFAIIRTMIPS